MKCLLLATTIRGSHSGRIRMSLEVHLQRRITISHQEDQPSVVCRGCNLAVHSQESNECSLEVCKECSQVVLQGFSLVV